MDEVNLKLCKGVEFLTPYLELVNSHMVEFFSKHLWKELVPPDLKQEFSGLHDHPVNIVDFFEENHSKKGSALSNFLQKCSELYPRIGDGVVLDFEEFTNIQNQVNQTDNICMFSNNSFMSEKKEHEVKLMSIVVSTISSLTNSSMIIDVGDGKGYLSSFISLKNELKVLGLDSCSSKTLGAAKRALKFQKQHSCLKNNTTSIGSTLQEDGCEMISKIHNFDTTSSYYKQMTVFISPETNLRNLLNMSFPSETPHKFGIVGLHTCGNLSPVCLNLFVNSDKYTTFLINVGCCYHLLEESQESNNAYTFPLSNFLKKKNFKLGRNARMLSLQASDRIYSHKMIPDSLMFRAVFECFFDDRIGKCDQSEKRVGRIGSKCKNFEEYCKKGLAKLGYDVNVSDAELQEYFKKYQSEQYLLNSFFMLRASLAPVIEYIILLDRLLYLHENGISNSFILKMFDSCISPRCFAIVSMK